VREGSELPFGDRRIQRWRNDAGIASAGPTDHLRASPSQPATMKNVPLRNSKLTAERATRPPANLEQIVKTAGINADHRSQFPTNCRAM
jgi:hypothetical protein